MHKVLFLLVIALMSSATSLNARADNAPQFAASADWDRMVAASGSQNEPAPSEPYNKGSFPNIPPPTKPQPPGEAAGCTYGYEMEVWGKDAIVHGNPWDHTATRTKIHEHCGGAKRVYKVVDKCNHGACPAQAGMKVKHYYISKAQTTSPLYPVGCDNFGKEYEALTKPQQAKNYGLGGDRHVCNNDTFLQMGEIVTGQMPDNRTVSRICRNKNYNEYTGRDPKYTPAFKNVEAFVATWGWNPAKVPAGGGGAPSPGRPKYQP